MKLGIEEFEKAKKSLYLKGSQLVNLPANLYEDIMLITASCGRGKSTYALSLDDAGLLADINKTAKKSFFPTVEKPEYEDIKPEETLVLSSRLAITAQQLKNNNLVKAIPEDFDGNNYFYDYERNGKIRATTAHSFGTMVKNGQIKKLPKVIVIDEIHSIFMEYFAEQLRYVIQFLEDNKNNIIKIGLTATPEVLEDYVKDFSFKRIDKDIGEKHLTNNLKVCVSGKATSILKQYESKIAGNYKAVYYTQSATQCYKLSQQYSNSAYMISNYNKTIIEDKETGEKINLVEKMKSDGVQEYVLENERLPEGIDILFINSACREGMNICDENVKLVICEAPDMMTIKQVRGRIRNNLEEYIVVCNYNYKRQNDDAIKAYCELIEEEENSANPQGFLGARYQKQLDNKNVQPFVYKYKDFYYINHYAEYYLKYIRETYLMIENGFYDEQVVSIGDKKILQYKEYYNQLTKFVEGRQIVIEKVWQETTKQNHKNGIEAFQKQEEKWLNKPLTKEDKDLLCAEMAIIRKNNKPAGWTTVKALLIDNGYKVESKRTAQQRFTIITN